MPTSDEIKLAAMLAELTADRIKELESYKYVPHAGQLAAHSSEARIRAAFIANRWGKTVWGVKEFVWWATGTHPYRKTPKPPVQLRIVGDGFDDGIDKIILPLFHSPIQARQPDGSVREVRLVNPEDLKGGSWANAYSAGRHLLEWQNGSVIEFMSFSQKDLGRGAQKFGGVHRDLTWFDEHGEHTIFDECSARVGARPNEMMLTYTPVLGKTWEYDEIYEPWTQGAPGIECFVGKIQDNPFLDPQAVADFLAGIKDPRMRSIRELGAWIDMGGSVYPMWNPNIHFIPYNQRVVDRITKIITIDPAKGSKPTAVLWGGIDDNGDWYFYREYRERLPHSEIARDIRSITAKAEEEVHWFEIDPHWGWEDVDTGKSVASYYIEGGVPVQPAYKGPEQHRIAKVQELMTLDKMTDKPKLYVMQTCSRLRWEIEHNQYKPQTQAMAESDRWKRIKGDDDLLDCMEYSVVSGLAFRGAVRSKHRPPKLSKVVARISGKKEPSVPMNMQKMYKGMIF